MNKWCYANIPDWTGVQSELQNFIISRVSTSDLMYNYIGAAEFKENCSSAVALIENYFDVALERAVIFKMTKQDVEQTLGNKFIHIDSGPRNVRLNWPILNPSSVVTKYFELTDPKYQPKRHFINPPFKDYIDVCDARVCRETDSVCVDQPVIFSVTTTPHGMFAAGDQWPRIMCSFNFVDDSNLVKYLQKTPENP